MIQNAIDNKIISSAYLNKTSLLAIAIYVLFGEQPTKWRILKDGTLLPAPDKELKNIAAGIWSKYLSSQIKG